MNRYLTLSVALLAATAVHAKPPKKPAEVAPPPAATFEKTDMKMGESLDEACLASPVVSETYDSNDNMLIVSLANGGHAFLHFEGGCNINTMMFAAEVTPKSANGACVAKGDALFFSDGYGGGTTCKISQMNSWHPERDALPDTEEMMR